MSYNFLFFFEVRTYTFAKYFFNLLIENFNYYEKSICIFGGCNLYNTPYS